MSSTWNQHVREQYDVQHMLGQGGFSTVWLCKHLKTQTLRAVKKVSTFDMGPQEISEEVATMRFCRHQNILRCHDVWLESDAVCVVVDLQAGGDLVDGLNAHRQSRGRIADAQLAHLARQMASAIRHVHALGIVHRDIKGENFLSDRIDIGHPDCVVVLADFGTARRLDESKTLSDKVGTPAFWAPEVFEGRCEFKADVWALGATCYVLHTGDLPMEGQTEICQRKGPGQLPFRAPSWTTPAHVEFMAALLSKDREQRPTAQQLFKFDWLKTSKAPERKSLPQPLLHAAVHSAVACLQVFAQLALDVCECFGECCCGAAVVSLSRPCGCLVVRGCWGTLASVPGSGGVRLMSEAACLLGAVGALHD